MYNLADFRQKSLNHQADDVFSVAGKCLAAFHIRYNGEMVWLVVSGVGDLEMILSQEEFESFKYLNQDVPFMDF